MGRFTSLVDIDGHGVYLPIFDVVGLIPIRKDAGVELDQTVYEQGGRSWIISGSGWKHASHATVEEIHGRITRLEEEQHEAEKARRGES